MNKSNLVNAFEFLGQRFDRIGLKARRLPNAVFTMNKWFGFGIVDLPGNLVGFSENRPTHLRVSQRADIRPLVNEPTPARIDHDAIGKVVTLEYSSELQGIGVGCVEVPTC